MKVRKTIIPDNPLPLIDWYSYISTTVNRFKGIRNTHTSRGSYPVGDMNKNKYKN